MVPLRKRLSVLELSIMDINMVTQHMGTKVIAAIIIEFSEYFQPNKIFDRSTQIWKIVSPVLAIV